MSLTDHIEIANISDVGMRRPHNEDSTLSDASMGLVILADGMGGYKAGEIASSLAITNIYKEVKAKLTNLDPDMTAAEESFSPESTLVKDAVVHANDQIFRIAQSDFECQGMGTTVIVCLFHDHRLTIGHVGDSRLYRFRERKLEQMTRDHSLIQELIDRGLYTPEEAMATTPKNLVTRALGIEASVDVDIIEQPVMPGDIYMLCSDGLNDMVDDEEIHLTLSKYSANLVQTAQELVAFANKKGGKDNISVILVRVLDHESASRGFLTHFFRRFFGFRGK